MTKAFCDQGAECGQIQVVCSDDGGEGFLCSAWTEPVTYEQCTSVLASLFLAAMLVSGCGGADDPGLDDDIADTDEIAESDDSRGDRRGR